jgi:ribokinase
MALSNRPAVTVVGSLHLDIMVEAPDRPRKGETLRGTAWGQKFGGKGGNQAVAAARLGAAARMVGAVGADDFGRRLVENLAAEGVDTMLVQVVAGHGSGMSVAIVDPSGDYGAIIVSGVNLAIGAEFVEASRAAFDGAGAVVLQNEIPDAANAAAARIARRSGSLVVLNAAPARPMPADLSVDVLVANEIEAEEISGILLRDARCAPAAAEALLETVPAAVVTLGGAGLVVAQRGSEPVSIPAFPVKLVSTHGAGDAFTGALAARLAAGDTLVDAARYGNAAAALHVSRHQSLSPDELDIEIRRLLSA